ncbi:putative UPF0481 protein At3g02645, partial [Gastrolobium bilobum]|uniref:putative UPF0481 protein At3g02645 n=1 Tax=Gastrolobium bilobum TaxID=150636 RepID=UPI002AB1F309
MISFGPIHHGREDLKQGEHYKLLWTSTFVEEYSKKTNQDTNRGAKLLHEKIEDNIEELKKLFTEDAIGSYNDNKDLTWMLFVDGCSLLYFMENVDLLNPEALMLKLDQQMYMFRDIQMLENQLPRRLLQMLCNENEANLDCLMFNCVGLGRFCKPNGVVKVPDELPEPLHILDLVRSVHMTSPKIKNFGTAKVNDVEDGENVINQQGGKEQNQLDSSTEMIIVWQTYKNIKDLKTAGIRVIANEQDKIRWNNISFTSKWFSGELSLPVFLFDDGTPYLFRNLIAHEMCPDFHNNFEFCSFLSFMDSLVDTAEDVKELRSAGIIQNLLGSDQELAQLFNELGYDLPTKQYCNFWCSPKVGYSSKYIVIRKQIEEHCSNKWKTWLAEGYNTHFNTPWTMIAFMAAFLACLQWPKKREISARRPRILELDGQTTISVQSAALMNKVKSIKDDKNQSKANFAQLTALVVEPCS